MRTTYQVKESEIERKWYVIDAQGQTLGRLSAQVSKMLMGKHKPTYTPHLDTGDYIIIINADKIHTTGKKLDQKLYRKHTGHPGGLRETTLRVMQQKKPEYVIMHAVKGMLPKKALGAKMLKKLRVYKGGEHPHAAQNPETITLTY
ncbi:MAG: 50S ribosomal protein L13 [Defluviitaleaceae bacterium]|nr:50S ribosomal protein L13 [Defluviitaleaceae bacterium]